MILLSIFSPDRVVRDADEQVEREQRPVLEDRVRNDRGWEASHCKSGLIRLQGLTCFYIPFNQVSTYIEGCK